MASRSLNTLTAGRGLAALAVLLFHVNMILALPGHFGYEIFPVSRGGNSGVQFFFVLSGFVILLAHRKDIGKPASLKTFAWKRFKRIYPPLWIILALVLFLGTFYPSIGVGVMRSPGLILAAFLIAPGGANFLLDPEWTLRHEIAFYIVFSFAISKRRLGFVIGALWFAASAILPLLHRNLHTGVIFGANNILFGLGMLVCVAFHRGTLRNITAWSLFTFGIILYAATWYERYRGVMPDGYLGSMLFGIGASMLIFSAINLERAGILRAHPVLIFLGEASYAIYLIHYPFVFLGAKWASETSLRTSPAGSFIAIIVICIAMGILFHLVIEKPILLLLSRKTAPAPIGAV